MITRSYEKQFVSRPSLVCGLLIALLTMAPQSARADIAHALDVELDPATHRIAVTDRITMPAAVNTVTFVLHAGLKPALASPHATLRRVAGQRRCQRGP